MSASIATIAAIPASLVGDEKSTPLPTIETLMAELRSAPAELLADILQELNRGIPLLNERMGSKPASAKKGPGRPKKEAAAPVELPAAEEGAPDASAYRLAEADIDHSVCVGRSLAGGEDKRWAPAVYREKQCGGVLVTDSDLCATCCRRLEKYASDPKAGPWTGRVTEEPEPWVHMLGTTWAESKQPKWKGSAGDGASAAETESVASAPSTKASKEEQKAAKEAEKEAKKAAAAAEKEAKKAAAAAEKEAKKAAAAAEKEAKKEAAAAAAAAKKAEAAAKKPATTKKATKAAAAPASAAPSEAKADASAVAVETDGELTMLDGTFYWVRPGKKVYEWDELAEKAGDYVGRLRADETIDTDATEEDE
jgi:hypothetical protein